MEEKKQEEWTMPEDIVVKETSKPEEMYNKYLAESVAKHWNEDFVDEDTGEPVTIERTEVIFDRGTYIDEDMLQKIMFSIQAEEIQTVKVVDTKPTVERANAQIRRYVVKLSDGLHTSNIYTTRCKTPEDAAQMVSDYHTVYGVPGVGGNFSVLESECTSLRMIYKEDIGVEHWSEISNICYRLIADKVKNKDKVLPPPYQKDRYWKVSVTGWYEGEEKYEKTTMSLVVCALTVQDAASFVTEYLNVRDSFERIYDVTSIGKAKFDYAIPQSYAATWCDKKYGVGNY